jgi:hypothetical protein
MFKRTNGYVLLTLLVLTGMAGQVTNETLNSRERRLLVNSLKDTRADLVGSINGLSVRQLDYRPAKGKPSIREHLYHIVAAESAFIAQARQALAHKAGAEGTAEINDVERAGQLAVECPPLVSSPTAPATLRSVDETLEQFKEERAKAIKYIRTTTQDVRAHTTTTPSGPADVYQLYLGMCAHQARHTRAIKEILASPGFPRK